MKIETNDWLTLAEAVEQTKLPQRTLYRIAERLGAISEFFGVKCVKKADIPAIVADRKRVGNPRWIESYEEASAAALAAVKSRKRRIAREKRASKAI